MSSQSSIRRMLTSATLSGLAVLVLAWPVAIHAEDPEASAEAANAIKLAPNATKFGDIMASSELITDENTKKHYIRFVATNTSQAKEAYANIELNVMKWESSPHSRVSPPPQLAYERTFRLILPPGESDVREIAVGGELARSLTRLKQREQAMAKGEQQMAMPSIFESYEALVKIPQVAAEPSETAVADNDDATQSASKSAQAIPVADATNAVSVDTSSPTHAALATPTPKDDAPQTASAPREAARTIPSLPQRQPKVAQVSLDDPWR